MSTNTYRHTATTVSLINHHFVLCPKYRRKIFRFYGVEDRFKAVIRDICSAEGIDIIAMECHTDHVHMFVSVPPKMAVPDIMHRIKGKSSYLLRQEFPALRYRDALWSRSYFVSTAGNVSSETVRWYVETQKTRP